MSLWHAKQGGDGLVVERLNHAAAPATAGSGKLYGLGGNAHVIAVQLLAGLGHEDGNKGGGTFAGVRAAPVFQSASPTGERKKLLACFTVTHERKT